MRNLASFKKVKPRFARSINVERDEGSSAIDGYLPVGRAIEVLGRLGVALNRPDVEVAISVTGPYGSGKSSLALVVDALFGPAGEPSTRTAEEIVGAAAPGVLEMLQQAKRNLGATSTGFIRAVATAQREPIIATVLRALHHGASRFKSPKAKKEIALIIREIEDALGRIGDTEANRPTSREIRQIVVRLGALAPILLIIDEFGKNLEAFADAHSEADLFLLQDLAEWTRGDEGIPLALMTLQHMAFDEYSSQASMAQRREWAKIQGRFEDVPFVDSATQTRALISAAFEVAKPPLAAPVHSWAQEQVRRLRLLGLNDLGAAEDQIELAWPLHPLAFAALPELCERYGQNERTLFSFLAGHEPLSVAKFLEENTFTDGADVPAIYLDRLYDYFIESAANLVSISSNATRWLEIDTRVRDATGISEGARRVLKAVGLLNLVSAGGSLRASKALVMFAATDDREDTETEDAVASRLLELEQAGLITYRDFADEYRIWNGTDFNIRSAIELARRRLRTERPAALMGRIFELRPVIAARHSYESGTLRAFTTGWVDRSIQEVLALTSRDRFDGLILYCLDGEAPVERVVAQGVSTPVIFAVSPSTTDLYAAAIEAAAIDEVLKDLGAGGDDWVARRELIERRVEASAELGRRFHESFAGAQTTWIGQAFQTETQWLELEADSASSATSQVASWWYSSSPQMRNDLINRHELSSQSAKARRVLLERLISKPEVENLGIEGFGPERTMYLSVYLENKMHLRGRDGSWRLSPPDPSSSFSPVWKYLNDRLKGSTTTRLRLSDLYEDLASAPFGIRAGVAPLLLIPALLIAGEEVALYEHGTFKPNLKDDTLERLLKNPGNFEVKYFSSKTGARSVLVAGLGARLNDHIDSVKKPSVLTVVSSLLRLVGTLPEYSRKTLELSPDAISLRRALLDATEPDILLFHDLPRSFGLQEYRASAKFTAEEISQFVQRVVEAAGELRSAYPSLLEVITQSLVTLADGKQKSVQPILGELAGGVISHVADPRLRSLCIALCADLPDLEDWVKYVGMVVVGRPPEGWLDTDRKRFASEIVELGGALKRLSAMHVQLPVGIEGKSYFRQLLTRSDGTEVAFVVGLTDDQRAILSAQVGSLLKTASEKLGVDIATAKSMMAVVMTDDYAVQ